MNARSNQHVVIVSPYATVTPHFETELELAQKHLDAGCQVTMLSCLGELKTCDFNKDSQTDRCLDCRLRRRHGFAQLDGKIRHLNFDQISEVANGEFDLPAPQNIAELKSLYLGEFDWGFACLSSLVSLCRDPEPDLTRHRDQLNRLLSASKMAYERFSQYLVSENPDSVFLFNGRFANMRAIFRACQENNVFCQIHERGCDTNHYQLFENSLPHDIEYVESRMRNAWDSAADDPGRDRIGEQWFLDRLDRVEKNWHSFVKDQTTGLLPDSWDSEKRNYVLFTSSEDEFVSIGDCWQNKLFRNQLEGIRVVSEILSDVQENANLTVRVHPNLRDVSNRQMDQLLSFRAPNTAILQADDPVDTYQLIRASDAVITFGSSVGIEATYFGKPSLLLGPSYYQNLDCTHRPSNLVELREMLSNQLSPKDRQSTLIYGYWFQTHGIRFDYFEADGLFSGTFKGNTIYAKKPDSVLRQWEKKLRRVRNRIFRPFRRAG